MPANPVEIDNFDTTTSGGLIPGGSVTNSEGSTILMNDIPITNQNVVLSKNVTDNLFEVQDQALIESLSRDVLLHNDSWTSSDDEIGTTMTQEQLATEFNQPHLYEISLPDDIVRKSLFMSNKLANIAYMRCDYEVTVRVQATPFLQGALWLWNKMNAKQTSIIRRTLTEHLRSITSFPGIEMNLQSEARAITLSIPYTSEFQVFNPRNVNNLNSIRLSVLSQLQGPEDVESASYSIYGRLKNIKLYGHAPSVTSSVYPSTQSGYDDDCPIVHAGTDEDSSKQGIVSRVADTVGAVANVVDGVGVPILSTIAKPVSWVSGVVSNVASMFGFSKDRDMTKVNAYENLPGKGFTHGVGFDYGVPLSLFPNNAIDPTIAVPEGLDEMSIEYLAQRPYMLNRYTIKGGDTPDVHGTIVADIPVSPVNFSLYGKVIAKYRTLFAAPVSLAVAMANWWRGNINLNLRFAKTQYHQCRLLVQYLPYGSGVQPIESILSQIIDISQVDDKGIDIAFPSVYPNKWMRVYDPAKVGYTADCAPGRIVISVLNPLISASTVSPNIVMYPWVHWSNLEVAEPGTLAKAAIGFNYPADVPEEPTFSVTRAPVSGTLFTLLQDTKVSLGEADGVFSLYFTNTTTGRRHRLAYAGLPGELGSCEIVKLPQGQYSIEYAATSAPTLVLDRPIFSEPIGPKYVVTKVKNGDVVSISEETLVTCGSMAAIGGATVALQSVDETIEILKLESDFESKAPVKFTPGNYTVVTEASDVELVTNQDITVNERIPRTHAGIDEEPPVKRSVIGRIVRRVARYVPNKFIRRILRDLSQSPCIYPSTHAGLDYSSSDTSTMLTTMGEQFVSLRMLTRRSSPVDILRGDLVTLPGISFGTDNSLRQSLVNIISYMYRFTHGSISYKIIPKNKGDLYITTTSPDSIETSTSAYQFDTNRAMHYINTSLNPMAQISLPYYSPAENLVIDSKSFPQLSDLSISNLERTENEYFVLASAGDDHTFSQLAGCPAFTFGPAELA
uniref:Capsid protein n=2 Tax=Taura syndrome virus TaxID=142102 RepID=Q5YLB0_9VIRU|nr:capsid protein precursor [Taura syndrome virus]